MIAALYVETGGVYFGLDDVDPWDETRDARLYAGPWPVVAHPPCAAWSRWRSLLRERAKPTARRLPQDGTWLELVRWCLTGEKNGGSRQWKAVSRWLRSERPEVTTVVSYSDPSAGHTGALYKACNWTWAPTWHRLFPPPSGNGSWKDGEPQSVKDRWVFVLRADPRRDAILSVKDGRSVAA